MRGVFSVWGEGGDLERNFILDGMSVNWLVFRFGEGEGSDIFLIGRGGV